LEAPVFFDAFADFAAARVAGFFGAAFFAVFFEASRAKASPCSVSPF
jgi:hypothetical protein